MGFLLSMTSRTLLSCHHNVCLSLLLSFSNRQSFAIMSVPSDLVHMDVLFRIDLTLESVIFWECCLTERKMLARHQCAAFVDKYLMKQSAKCSTSLYRSVINNR